MKISLIILALLGAGCSSPSHEAIGWVILYNLVEAPSRIDSKPIEEPESPQGVPEFELTVYIPDNRL